MLKSVVSAIPQALSEIWYVYQLLLLLAIGASIALLLLMKRRSPEKEGERSLNSAAAAVGRARGQKTAPKRLKLFIAANMLSSAVFNFEKALSREDKFSVREKAERARKAAAYISNVLKSEEDVPDSELDYIVSLINGG
ncbi:MAG TPA: hypothetical protein P5161_03420 [Eubacteriales bacterium]|jgi:hypothetical protein|nr:hypothetical protein [Clostridia bacterium]HRR89807.1 hypothetical protein [Eubacteriales bacterium]HRU84319.1 hypothetical protein [Eubacteriales bacterium]